VDLRDRITRLMGGVRDELAEIVAIPSVADAHQYPPAECARAAEWVRDRFAGLGFADAHLAETADGSLAVIGSRRCADSEAPTVLLYAHYDVQPPLDEAAWRAPPFQLTEIDGRWYGRGVADRKGKILRHLTASRALEDVGRVHLGLVVEGPEEQGTGGWRPTFHGHRSRSPRHMHACMHVSGGTQASCGSPPHPSQEVVMILLVVAAVLAVLWLLGLVAFHVTAFAIHLLLIAAVIAVIAHFALGKRSGRTRV
jgi:acetylornithine deacetylase/succinyl-diaminopimelate desuccinylase-like protein